MKENVKNGDVFDAILSSKEASEILNVTQGYLRQLNFKGEFQDWEFRKLGNTTIYLRESIEKRRGKFREYKKDETLS